jgi:hypothetical protein
MQSPILAVETDINQLCRYGFPYLAFKAKNNPWSDSKPPKTAGLSFRENDSPSRLASQQNGC